MENQNYYSNELAKISINEDFIPSIKIVGGFAQTKWLPLNEESANELRKWLDKNYPDKNK